MSARYCGRVFDTDSVAHDWYRFILAFPPHLVRKYLERFKVKRSHCVLDPFCGTGTTLVECKKLKIPSIGVEANHVARFAAQVKTDWSINPETLIEHAQAIVKLALIEFEASGVEDARLELFSNPLVRVGELRTLSDESFRLLLTDSISPLPLHKTLILLDAIYKLGNRRYQRFAALALARALVSSIGNLRFRPEVSVGEKKADTPVLAPWFRHVETMAKDLSVLKRHSRTSAMVYKGDARECARFLSHRSIDFVITSPPYPNEKDYSRSTRLESVLLGFLREKADLRALKQSLICSNTRNVYKDDADDEWVKNNARVQEIAHKIEARRVELAKTSGFEKRYATVTKLYFGGLARHLSDLRLVLRPGAQLAYVVGDQMSYLRVLIHTGQILAEIAQSLGYELLNIDLFRTRFATATKEKLREEVVLLRWNG